LRLHTSPVSRTFSALSLALSAHPLRPNASDLNSIDERAHSACSAVSKEKHDAFTSRPEFSRRTPSTKKRSKKRRTLKKFFRSPSVVRLPDN
jgi:hypothetical protein